MRTKYTLLAIFALISSNAFSNEYKDDINNLQKQIDELNKKISNQSNNTRSLDKFLDGFKVNGRIHVTGNWYDEDNELKSYDSNDYNDRLSIKRARFAISKDINDFEFHFEGNFDKDRSYLGETYLAYNLDKNSALRVGQITNPSFMEREKSTNTMSEIECNSFIRIGWIPSYLIGLNYYNYSDDFGLSTGIFGNGTSFEGKLQNNTSYNFSFRSFYTPIRDDKTVIHLGFDFAYQDYKHDTVNNPGNVDNNYYFGLEAGLRYKIFNWNTEYIKTFYKYERDTFDGKKFNFDGISTELVLSLTGEYRQYSKAGYFTGVKVKNPLSKGGYGAFETAFRYSRAYGEDSRGSFTDNIGSRYDYTFGINWFPEDYFMILVDYSINSIKNSPLKDSGSRGKYNAFNVEFRMFF